MPAKKGLYANIQAKRKRIAKGSGEKMREPGEKGAPSKKDFKESEKTAKKRTVKPKSKSRPAGSAARAKPATRKKSSAK